MKAILISIRPQWVAKILNGEKTIEIRRKFSKDYVGWVYIYVTKGKLNLVYDQDYDDKNQTWKKGKYELVDYGDKYSLNGKVVARFWCDKVDDYVYGHKWSWKVGAPMWGADNSYEKILKDACLTDNELRAYADELSFSAIYITKLEIFNEPKDISESLVYSHTIDGVNEQNKPQKYKVLKHLARAPQSWCYIEV